MPALRRTLLRAAVADLTAGGVASASYDAEELLAHALGVPRSRLVLVDEVADETAERFRTLVTRRAGREPLQHLTGVVGFRHVELAIGPGVFVPRPETELLAGWAIEQARLFGEPVIVDLCTGSGAIARALADEVPRARVHAVELDETAFDWATRNLAGTAVDLRHGSMADAFDDLDGHVDVVVCNPPYIPLEAWESVAPEARDHDPHLALFSGSDGLNALRMLEQVARRLLRSGGVIGAEHADVQGRSAPEIFSRTAHWHEIEDHVDLVGRPRFVTARLR